MSENVKKILIVINVFLFGIAIYWLVTEPSPEPLFVLAAQIATLFVIIFEKKIPSKMSISRISKDSTVNVDTPTNDDLNLKIKKVEKGSSVNIKRK